MIPRERLIETARRVYRSYGFSPIDTPALEYLEILAGKGSEETDKQLYKFQDQGERWVACGSISPCRWPASPPSTSTNSARLSSVTTSPRSGAARTRRRGRYREFMQCDFDTIGTALDRLRHRNGPGDPRPAPGHRLRATSPSA